ncbi:MAG: hypothetical protein R6V85_02065 [Polyangia bacterium]
MSRARAQWPLAGLLLAGLLVGACSSCSGPGADPDGGPDSGGDMDSDIDTGTGTYKTDAGPWDWEDLPPGEDCGPGCEQIAITEHIEPREWDVWDDHLVFMELSTKRIQVIDTEEKKGLSIPDVYPDHPIIPGQNGTHSPVIFDSSVVYYLWILETGFERISYVHTDLQNFTQEIIWETDESPEGPSWIPEFDVYDSRIASDSGGSCGGASSVLAACLREQPWPSEGEPLNDCSFGISVWGNRIVCIDTTSPPDDITAYDLDTKQPFPITDDDEYQIFPRIHEDLVVWQDFRLGAGEPTGSWEHCAIFVKDLGTGDTTQITDGAAIAAYPDVHGDVVVWQDYRHCDDPQDKNDFDNVEIYGYNLATETEARITSLPGRPKVHPRVWGDRVFVDMQTLEGGNAIFVFDLPDGLR